MKVRKVTKKVSVPETHIHKRLDLNPKQRNLLDKVNNLSVTDLNIFLDILKQEYPTLPNVTTGFFDPIAIGKVLGISHVTMDLYTHLYLRIVKREDESSNEYKTRKIVTESDLCPLQTTPSGYHRVINPRCLLFCVLAPTRVNNTKLKQVREEISKKLNTSVAKSSIISSNEQTRHWNKES